MNASLIDVSVFAVRREFAAFPAPVGDEPDIHFAAIRNAGRGHGLRWRRAKNMASAPRLDLAIVGRREWLRQCKSINFTSAV